MSSLFAKDLSKEHGASFDKLRTGRAWRIADLGFRIEEKLRGQKIEDRFLIVWVPERERKLWCG